MTKKIACVVAFLTLTAVGAFATETSWKFLSALHNARFVYVTSYSGSQFSPNPLPQDRQAMETVQNSFQKWGKYVLVYRPEEADMIVMVQSRGSEDVLAVYSRSSWKAGAYLWRDMGKGGFSQPSVPLFRDLQAAINRVDGGPEVPAAQPGQ